MFFLFGGHEAKKISSKKCEFIYLHSTLSPHILTLYSLFSYTYTLPSLLIYLHYFLFSYTYTLFSYTYTLLSLLIYLHSTLSSNILTLSLLRHTHGTLSKMHSHTPLLLLLPLTHSQQVSSTHLS